MDDKNVGPSPSIPNTSSPSGGQSQPTPPPEDLRNSGGLEAYSPDDVAADEAKADGALGSGGEEEPWYLHDSGTDEGGDDSDSADDEDANSDSDGEGDGEENPDGDSEDKSEDGNDSDDESDDSDDDSESDDEDKDNNKDSEDKPEDKGVPKPSMMGKDEKPKSDEEKVKDAMKKQVVKQTASVGGKVGGQMAKTKLMAMIMQAIIKAVTNFIHGIIQGIVGFLVTVATAVMNFFATVGIIVSVFLIGGGLGLIALAIFAYISATKPPPEVDEGCMVEVEQLEEYMQNSQAELERKRKINEDKIYLYLESQGFSKEQIAGVLGNLKAESYSLDPTQIEGIYSDEKYIMGPKKHAIMKDQESINAHAKFVIESTKKSGNSASEAGYLLRDGTNYHFGIGLTQWTAERAVRLKSTADLIGVPWYSFDFQLVYMMVEDGYKPIWDSYKSVHFSSPEEAAETFGRTFIGNWTNGVDKRVTYAIEVYEDANAREADISGLNNIAQVLSKNVEGSAKSATEKSMYDSCGRANPLDTSSLVSTALSLAVPNSKLSRQVGNPIYNGLIIKYDSFGEKYQRSCDRGVCAAMRASNTDINYPLGNCSVQMAYLAQKESEGEYMMVAEGADITKDKLLPGDIFISKGHTFIYLGEESVAGYDFSSIQNNLKEQGYDNVEVEKNGDTYEASYLEKYAGISRSSTFYMSRNGVHNDGGLYKVYRKMK